VYHTGYFDEFINRPAQGAMVEQVSGGNFSGLMLFPGFHKTLSRLYIIPYVRKQASAWI
jgi:hypothetical protein